MGCLETPPGTLTLDVWENFSNDVTILKSKVPGATSQEEESKLLRALPKELHIALIKHKDDLASAKCQVKLDGLRQGISQQDVQQFLFSIGLHPVSITSKNTGSETFFVVQCPNSVEKEKLLDKGGCHSMLGQVLFQAHDQPIEFSPEDIRAWVSQKLRLEDRALRAFQVSHCLPTTSVEEVAGLAGPRKFRRPFHTPFNKQPRTPSPEKARSSPLQVQKGHRGPSPSRGSPKPFKKVNFGCPACMSAGRAHFHNPANCWYRPNNQRTASPMYPKEKSPISSNASSFTFVKTHQHNSQQPLRKSAPPKSPPRRRPSRSISPKESGRGKTISRDTQPPK